MIVDKVLSFSRNTRRLIKLALYRAIIRYVGFAALWTIAKVVTFYLSCLLHALELNSHLLHQAETASRRSNEQS